MSASFAATEPSWPASPHCFQCVELPELLVFGHQSGSGKKCRSCDDAIPRIPVKIEFRSYRGHGWTKREDLDVGRFEGRLDPLE